MQAIRLLLSLLALLVLSDFQAQNSINSAGLDVSSSTGSISMSAGQSTYITVESFSDFSKSFQGVQIPYEAFIVYCAADINKDGFIDVIDFLELNSLYGTICTDCRADINRDGIIDILDFLELNSAFGSTCNAGGYKGP